MARDTATAANLFGAVMLLSATAASAMPAQSPPATILKCTIAKIDSGAKIGSGLMIDASRVAGHAAGESFWYKIDANMWEIWDPHFGVWRDYCEFHPHSLTRRCFTTPLRYVANLNPFGEHPYTEDLDRISGQIGFDVVLDRARSYTASGNCGAAVDPEALLPAPRF